ncbi:MAG: methylmalonyl-CoA epimerase [candidate division KSB1 bacterium]|nr:methylmalonyl-CoA epimerase [candidate division KSB1 bacterium]MDZ7368219.1 methylmalonyl-CoA epimerase [candidate division KSB1 bacterium]MDZ7403943.1 methylmalonyl-CoA epimerase [candidate division KSB1 bacterium]
MLNKIDHIGIAVRDLDAAIARYTALCGQAPNHLEEVLSQKVNVAMFDVGESRVELLMATAPDSPIAKFIDKRGEGMHHICFKVANLEAALARMSAAGMEIIPGAGGEGAGGSRVAFLHPKSLMGVMVELVEQG